MPAKRRTEAERYAALRRCKEALDSLDKSGLHPGFDYSATLNELLKVYDYDQIATFFQGVSKGTISKWRSGRSIPSHDRGELLYTLYVETFNEKSDYVDQKVPPRKPPNKKVFLKANR